MPGCGSASRAPACWSAAGAGGIDVAERQYAEFFGDGWKRVTPYAIPVSIVGMISSEISIALELHGISHVVSTGCTSSTDAISYAASLIRRGEAEVLLTGGADACVTPGMIFGFSKMRAVSTRYNDQPAAASRPFDAGRDGFVLGEGAWMVVLEREDRARARGAHDLRHDRRLRLDLRRVPPRADGSGRRADRARDGARGRTLRPAARGDRLRQLSRHVDGPQRCRRVALRAPAVRRRAPTASPDRRPSR